MRRVDIDDMDAVMSFKGKARNWRYAFKDYSDRIKVVNNSVKILQDRIKRKNNQPKKEHMGKPMEGAEALLKLKASMAKPQLVMVYKDQKNVRCDTTHIFTSEHVEEVIDGIEFLEEMVFNGIITLSQAKKQCPGIQSIHWSRSSDGEIGNMYSIVGNVH